MTNYTDIMKIAQEKMMITDLPELTDKSTQGSPN